MYTRDGAKNQYWILVCGKACLKWTVVDSKTVIRVYILHNVTAF